MKINFGNSQCMSSIRISKRKEGNVENLEPRYKNIYKYSELEWDTWFENV
jgi:hypothetical protein